MSVFNDTIKEYLDNFAAKDNAFNEKYNNPEKSIEECCNYICGEVQKLGVQGLADSEVYGLAVHYYQEDNKELEPIGDGTGCKVVVNKHIEISEEEKAKMKKIALEEYKEKELEKLEKKNAKEKAKEEKKIKETGVEQLCLL